MMASPASPRRVAREGRLISVPPAGAPLYTTSSVRLRYTAIFLHAARGHAAPQALQRREHLVRRIDAERRAERAHSTGHITLQGRRAGADEGGHRGCMR